MKPIMHLKLKSNRLFLIMVGVTCLILFSNYSIAQTDSSSFSKSLTKRSIHSPQKAALLSAVLPGAGQVYNKKYWKVPVIYAGAGALAYSFSYNQKKYIKYRNAYKYRIDGDAATVDEFEGKYSEDNLNTLQKYYHRYRDLTVIGMAVLYVLNIVDASVDAHLFSFDVSDNISMNIQPVVAPSLGFLQKNNTCGLSITIGFR